MTVPGVSSPPLATPLPSAFADPPDKAASKPPAPFADAALNPYASPAIAKDDHVAAFGGELGHERISAGELLQLPWTIFTTNIGPLAILGVMMFVVYFALGMVGFVLQLASMNNEALSLAFQLGMNVVQFIAQSVLSIAGINYCLKLLRTGRAEMGDMVNIGPFVGKGILKDFLFALIPGLVIAVFAIFVFVSMPALMRDGPQNPSPLVFILLFGGIAVIGLMMLVLTIHFLLSGPLIVDRRLGVIESLTTSWRLVSGNSLSILASGFVTVLLGGIATLCTCYLGSILFMPYGSLYICIAYLLITGQRHTIAPQALGRAVSYPA